ncbi:MAG: heme exporter protein CcmD [Burkholderiales bacterium]|jgi:heme exporter protein D|nr:heme exporter protein CcmD [Burkholderiales bacterium]
MKWESASQFFAMGGHGLYVWGSYAVALAVVVIEVAMVRARFRKALVAAPAPKAGSDAA